MVSGNGKLRRRPPVVELVGPAGVGKSTLVQALAERDRRALTGLTLWGLPRHLLFGSALELVPPIVTVARDGRRLQAGEIGQLIRLGALRRVLEEVSGSEHSLLVLDEGPVFALSWLEVFFGRNGDRGWARWRARAIADWAARLDIVVRLDAPSQVLARRIRTRSKPHMVKESSDKDIRAFSDRFRRAFDRVIAELKAAGHLRVVRMRTDVGPPEAMALRLRIALEEMQYER